MIGTDYIENLKKFGNNNNGYYLDDFGVYKPESTREQVISGYPWVFFGDAASMPCRLWHSLYFNSFGFIHSVCATSCFKTCIVPKTVKELFLINDYLEENDFHSKCGTDLRPYTHNLYLGVIYSDCLETAKEEEKKIKSDLDLKIFTKKGCTEFENRLSSNLWVVTPVQLATEAQLEIDVDHSWAKEFKQSEWMKQSIRTSWVQMAYSAGDDTYKDTLYKDEIKKSRTPFKY